MPAAVLAALGSIGASALNAGERVLSFLNTAVFSNLILVGLNRARKKPQAPGMPAPSFAAPNISVRQPISPWQIIIGRRRVGGIVTFMFLASDKRYLHMVVTLASHVCDGIMEIWLDDEVILPSMLDASSLVTSGRFSRSTQVGQNENVTVPSVGPYTVTLMNTPVDSVWAIVTQPDSDGNSSRIEPGTGYTVAGNVITFDSSLAGAGLTVSYTQARVDPITRIEKSLGTEVVQPFPDLVAESEGKWTDAHRQTGHTKIYIRFDTSILQGSVPSISAVVRGQKLFDPRTSTTVWSMNPGLAVAAYLQNTEIGLSAATAEIASSELQAAANVCDERVGLATATATFTADATADTLTLASGSRMPEYGDGVRVASTGSLPTGLSAGVTYYVSSPFPSALTLKLSSSFANALAGTTIDLTTAGSGTLTLTYFDEPRFRANGAFLASDRPVDAIQQLLASMAGTISQVSDTWRIFAGAYEAATITLTEKDFAGAVQIEPMPARDQYANGAKGVFVDPASNWQPTDFPAIAPTTTYLAEDGGETIYADLDFTAFVTSSGQSQRLARIEVRRARSGLMVTATFKLTAWRAFTGHSVAITFAKYGWSSKEFIVVSSGFAVIQSTGTEGPALGVTLTLRETNSTIFSWSAEDVNLPTPPHTSLPNPFSVAAPGAPTVTEELYETTGSAGVKSRATVSWTAVNDPLVKRYEVQWKEGLDPGYQIALVQGATILQLEDLRPGNYVFAVRSDNGIAKSVWSSPTVVELLGLTAPPENPTGFSVIASNGYAVARWDLSPDLDVRIGGRAVVRFSPLTSGAAWEDGILVSGTVDLPGFPGDTILGGSMPLKSGTYLLKFLDSSGNFSTTAASFVATEGMVTGFTTVVTITEDASFTGSKTQVVLSGSQIQLDTSGGAVFSTGSYAFAGTSGDLTTVASRRFEATIKASSFDVGANIDSILANIDDWDSIDGSAVNDCNVVLMIRTTNDNPSGSPTWGPWTPFHVGDFSCRAAQFRLDFTSGNPQHNIAVTQLRVAIKSADVAPLGSPAFTGTPTAATAAVDTSTTQIATTAFVIGQATSATPAMDGTGAAGSSTRYARADHVHPTDTSRDAAVSRFESSEQTLTQSTVTTVAHSLGATPKTFSASLRCKTAEFGYSVGDEILFAKTFQASVGDAHCVFVNSTNIGFVLSNNNIDIIAQSDKASHQITMANWKMVLRCSIP